LSSVPYFLEVRRRLRTLAHDTQEQSQREEPQPFHCFNPVTSNIHEQTKMCPSFKNAHRSPNHMADVMKHEALSMHGQPHTAHATFHKRLWVRGIKAENLTVEGLSDTIGSLSPCVLSGESHLSQKNLLQKCISCLSYWLHYSEAQH